MGPMDQIGVQDLHIGLGSILTKYIVWVPRTDITQLSLGLFGAT